VNTKNFIFSASSVKEYMQCGLKFKFNRIDKLEKTDVSSHHRWFGTLVHNLIYASLSEPAEDLKKMVLTNKINEKYPMKIFETVWKEKESEDLMVQTIRKDLGEKPVGRFMRGKIVSLGINDPDITQAQLEKGWKAEAKKMVKNGISVVKEIPEIVELERKLFWIFQNRKFLGYADILAKDESGRYTFYDFKTTWDKPGKRLDDDFQFFSYSHALKSYYNLDYYPVGNYVHLRSGDVIPYEVTPEIISNMNRKAKKAFDNMEANIFFDDYGGSLCPYCDFRHICYGKDSDVWKNSSFGG
jgi:hypothetical protein